MLSLFLFIHVHLSTICQRINPSIDRCYADGVLRQDGAMGGGSLIGMDHTFGTRTNGSDDDVV